MKSILKATTVVLFVLSSLIGRAEENTLLWSVSGNGLSDTSYLFGTIHIICQSDYEMRDKVTTAFDKVEQVYLEIDMDDPKESKVLMNASKGDKPLTEILTPEEQKKLDAMLQEEVGVSLAMVNGYSLNTISTLFLVKRLPCEEIATYETELVQMAQEKGLEIKGLEKAKEQLKILKEYQTKEEILEGIMDAGEGKEMLEKLMKAYVEESLDDMEEIFLGEEHMSADQEEMMLTQRNNNWIKKMPKIMNKKSTFFAVGSAHLIGEVGLIAQLRALGYTVSPILK